MVIVEVTLIDRLIRLIKVILEVIGLSNQEAIEEFIQYFDIGNDLSCLTHWCYTTETSRAPRYDDIAVGEPCCKNEA